MAKDNIDKTQIFEPVGSVAEVEALRAPVRNIATCSAHTDHNFGCPVWVDCERPFKGTRPRVERFRIVKEDGSQNEGSAPCFHNVKRAAQIEANGGLFELLPGPKYRQRGAVPLHPNRDPSCPDCMRPSGCFKMQTLDPDEPDTLVPEFPPAERHPDLVKYVRAKKARSEAKAAKRERRKQELLGPDDELDELPVDDEVGGSSDGPKESKPEGVGGRSRSG